MEDHETRRKVIRQWMSLPKDKRQTPEQAAEFAKKAVEQNELQPSRRVAFATYRQVRIGRIAGLQMRPSKRESFNSERKAAGWPQDGPISSSRADPLSKAFPE